MFKRIVLVFGLFLAVTYYIGIAGYAEAVDPKSDPRCKGLSGAAYGMCASAIMMGCDDLYTTIPGCTEVEEFFTEITGEPPPWLPCPCGTTESFLDHLETQGGAKGCTDIIGESLSIHSELMVNSVFSHYPGQQIKETCGLDNTSKFELTDEQAKSCLIELRAVIDKYGFKCDDK